MKTWTMKFEGFLTMSLVNVKNVAIVVDLKWVVSSMRVDVDVAVAVVPPRRKTR